MAQTYAPPRVQGNFRREQVTARHTHCKKRRLCPVVTFNPRFPENTVDVILIIGILVLVLALLGFGGVIAALESIAWVLLILAIIVIAWRVIAGRRPV
jgi:uncharacterized membrane protein YtjA (UPF0391 family)